jgi:riboflavin biosynthesis pyrimidine reductase
MNRPKVTVHSVASVDGRITVAPGCLLLNGDPRWQALAGSGDDTYRHVMAEYQPQVILEGSGSLVLDGTPVEPLPEVEGDAQVLFQDFLPESVVNRAGARGWLAVVDSGGRVRWFYKEFPGEDWAGWYLLVLVSRKTPPEYLAYLRREMIPYLVVGDEHVELPAAMDRLAEKLGVTRVVSTAGGRLNGALLRAGLVDEVELDFLPALIGGAGTPSLFNGPALKPEEWPARLKLLSCQVMPGDIVRLHYGVER